MIFQSIASAHYNMPGVRVGHAGDAVVSNKCKSAWLQRDSQGPSWANTLEDVGGLMLCPTVNANLNSRGRTARESDTHREVAGFIPIRLGHCVLHNEGAPLSQATKHQQSF